MYRARKMHKTLNVAHHKMYNRATFRRFHFTQLYFDFKCKLDAIYTFILVSCTIFVASWTDYAFAQIYTNA